MKRILAIATLLLAGSLLADEMNPPVLYVPNAETIVTTKTVRLKHLHLANISGGTLTVIIKDRSTNCNASQCQIWPTVNIAANSVYTAELGGVPVVNGFTWQASSANSVVGYITYQ